MDKLDKLSPADVTKYRQAFYQNPGVNPVTGRSVEIGKATYKKLVEKFGAPPGQPGAGQRSPSTQAVSGFAPGVGFFPGTTPGTFSGAGLPPGLPISQFPSFQVTPGLPTPQFPSFQVIPSQAAPSFQVTPSQTAPPLPSSFQGAPPLPSFQAAPPLSSFQGAPPLPSFQGAPPLPGPSFVLSPAASSSIPAAIIGAPVQTSSVEVSGVPPTERSVLVLFHRPSGIDFYMIPHEEETRELINDLRKVHGSISGSGLIEEQEDIYELLDTNLESYQIFVPKIQGVNIDEVIEVTEGAEGINMGGLSEEEGDLSSSE